MQLTASLENTGQRAKAQDLILGALNKQVGGAGVKSAQGLAGALDSVSEKFTIFIEKSKIGRAVVDFLTAAMNRLADSMGDAMQDAEALSGKMEIINRILLTQEKIAQRIKSAVFIK